VTRSRRATASALTAVTALSLAALILTALGWHEMLTRDAVSNLGAAPAAVLYAALGALVVDWKPYRDAGSDETRRGARQLFAGVSAVGFAYFDPGGADRPPGWRDEWHAMPILPTLVKVSVAFADGASSADLSCAISMRASSRVPWTYR